MKAQWFCLAAGMSMLGVCSPAMAQAIGQPPQGYVAPRQVVPGAPPQPVEFRGQERANLGVTLSDNNGGKVWIRAVHKGSPADEAGLRPNDQIVAIDEKPVQTYLDVIRIINSKGASDDVRIDLRRNGRPGMLTAALGSQYSGVPTGSYTQFPASETQQSGNRGLPNGNPPPAGYTVPNTAGPYNR
jgi:membrane-associated protease RseP (regulator of RpoE activity)